MKLHIFHVKVVIYLIQLKNKDAIYSNFLSSSTDSFASQLDIRMITYLLGSRSEEMK